MTEKKSGRIFIYDRKEMAVLLLLGVMVALFAFTLGVHLGKHVTPEVASGPDHETHPVLTQADKVPENPEIAKAGDANNQKIEEGLNQSLHQEVEKSGLKLDEPRQVELPTKTRSRSGGATSPDAAPIEEAKPKTAVVEPKVEPKAEPKKASAVESDDAGGTADAVQKALKKASKEVLAVESLAPLGKYTLQVGSYPSVSEAQSRLEVLEKDGMQPFIRSVELKGKGLWHRVFVGGFASKDEAEKAGRQYKTSHKISSFIVANRPE